MGLFEKIFRPPRGELKEATKLFQTLTAYQPAFTNWRGAIYESEIVRAAIDARARHISKLKVETVGTASPVLQRRLAMGPNQWQTWSQFLYRTSTILDVNNTAFIVPVMDERRNTTGVYPVLPKMCTLVEYDGELYLRYQFTQGKYVAVEASKCAIMTKHQYESDFFGDNNNALRETMQLMHMQKQGIEEGVKNSATFRFMAVLNNFAKAEDLAKERERFTETNLSAGNGGFLLFPNTYKDIKQIDVKPYAIDAEQIKQIKENVFNYFGVSEELLQNKTRAEDLEGFFDGAIEPFAIQFSEVMTKMLFTEPERARGSFLIANANRLQYMSVPQKVQMAQQLLDRGVMSINEARELFNYSTVEDGDTRFIRGEYADTTDKVNDSSNENEGDAENEN